MKAALLVLGVLALAGREQHELTWVKLDMAKCMAGQDGRLVLVYIACEPGSGKMGCGITRADRAFGDPAILKRSGEFHFVRVTDKKTAALVRASEAPQAIFLDGDGDEISRASFTDGASLEQGMAGALKKYAPREVAWSGADPAKLPEGKPVLLVFADDRKDSEEVLKALEDRSVAKFHDRFQFVRVAYRRDSEETRKWGVSQAPTLVAVDPGRREGVEKMSGRKPVKDVRSFLGKALAKFEKK